MRRALTIAALALALTACDGPSSTLGTATAPLLVSPISYDFGAIEVGQTTAPRLFIVSAAFSESDYVDSITSSCPEFIVDTSGVFFPAEVSRDCDVNPNDAQRGSLLPPCPSITVRFYASFAPSFAGPQSCSIDVALQFNGVISVPVTGVGTPPPVAQTVISPAGTSLDFGDVVVGGSSASLAVVLRSTGGTPLDIVSATVDSADPNAFQLSEAGSDPLPPGEDYTWSLLCRANAAGPITGTFTIVTDAPDSPRVFDLRCDGIESSLAVNPSPAQFGERLIGDSEQQEIFIGNSGTAPLSLGSVTTTGRGFSVTAPPVAGLAPGESTSVFVTFTPDAADAGTDVHGTLDVVFDSGSRSIDLIGPARDAALNVTPSAEIDFGTICAGQSGDQLFVAVNTGTGGTQLDGVDVSGEGFTSALIAPTALPAPLAARGGSSATFRIAAAPPIGDVTGTLTLTAAIPGAAPTTIPLRARGQAGGIGASPGAIDFGGVVVGEPSGGRTVRLNNCDAGPITVDRATLSGAASGEFLAVSAEQTLPTTVPAGGSLLFIVELRPTTAGDKVATLTIGHGESETTIALTGLGVGDELTGDGARGSYYACSAGGDAHGATGLGVLGLALGVALRRRRARR